MTKTVRKAVQTTIFRGVRRLLKCCGLKCLRDADDGLCEIGSRQLSFIPLALTPTTTDECTKQGTMSHAAVVDPRTWLQ